MVELTPVKAMRLKCLDCCCMQETEVRLCPSEDCSLWPYRMGKVDRGALKTTEHYAGYRPREHPGNSDSLHRGASRNG